MRFRDRSLNKIFFCPKCLKEWNHNLLHCSCGESLLYANEEECETAVTLYREGGIDNVLERFGDRILASNTPSSDSNVSEQLVEGESNESSKGSKGLQIFNKILDEMEEELESKKSQPLHLQMQKREEEKPPNIVLQRIIHLGWLFVAMLQSVLAWLKISI